MSENLQLAILEPYWGGSHAAFVDAYARHSRHHITIATMPARKWKWRMRGAAVWFARENAQWLTEHDDPGIRAILCSDMLSVADLRALLPPAQRNLPIVCYFHENQLTYPIPEEADRDYQYGMTNITSCLAADAVWFNSQFHLDQFVEAAKGLLGKMPDCVPADLGRVIRAKSAVHPPPMERPPDTLAGQTLDRRPLRVLWSHRWEYDKNPEPFFQALDRLHHEGYAFELVLLGEQFRSAPPAFQHVLEKLSTHIVHAGFLPDRSSYWKMLSTCHLVVSSAIQENFGMAVVEAVLAGCQPLLPSRLAYPEIIPHAFHGACLYAADNTLYERLRSLMENAAWLTPQNSEALRRSLLARFGADVASASMDDALTELVEPHH